MISSFSFQSYKSFEKGNIDLKPITILIGANSSGKTSLIQLLLLLSQTADTDFSNNAKRPIFKSHGDTVSIGEAKSLFTEKSTQRVFRLKLNLNNNILFDEMLENCAREFDNFLHDTYEFIEYQHRKNKEPEKEEMIKARKYKYEIIYGDDKSDIRKRIIKFIKDNLKFIQNTIYKKNLNVKSRFRPIREFKMRNRGLLNVDISNLTLEDLDNAHSIISFLTSAKQNNNRFTMEVASKLNSEQKIYPIEIGILLNGRSLFKLHFSNKMQFHEIKSDLIKNIDWKTMNTDFEKFFDANQYLFNIASKEKIPFQSICANLVCVMVDISLDRFKSTFSNNQIHHVSPLRAYPRRFYFSDPLGSNGKNDESFVETLHDNSSALEMVNKWLQEFGVSVKIKEVKEIIRRVAVSPVGASFDVDITDVGFGLSQIIPVILKSFEAKNGQLVIVEQPEIHLHPKMQARIADFFIDRATDRSGPNFLIETHSEYLVKRMCRRIAEGTLRASDIAVYYTEPSQDKKGINVISERSISQNGILEWPLDYYEDDIENMKAVLLSNNSVSQF